MAGEAKVLFEVDAAKILAKLHLAGVQASGKDAGSFIVNTGVKNDDQNAKPENPGKVEFDLENTQNDYEVGYVYSMKFTPGKSVDQLFKLLGQISAVISSLKKDVESKPATGDDAKKVESKAQKNYEALTGNLKNMINDYDETINKNEDFSKMINVIQSVSDVTQFNESWAKEFKDASFGDKLTSIRDQLGEDDEKARSDYDKSLEEAKKNAAQHLISYLNAFAGPGNVDKAKAANPFMIVVSDDADDPSSKSLVANYEIQPISEQEAAKKKEEYQANAGKEATQKVCFKVRYTLKLDK